jgi:hypothetical protein
MLPRIMSEYRYSQLSTNSIRLLRLLPSENATKSIQCELFEYYLGNSNVSSHPYEALSYVWGSELKPNSIIIDNQCLKITHNLYMALLHLRDHGCPRVIWIDAICINQENDREKEHQIKLMAKIYVKASRVVIWLGDAEDDSDQALGALRLAGENSTRLSNPEFAQQAILQLLQRPWFQRIWVRD